MEFFFFEVFGLSRGSNGSNFSLFTNILLPAGISFFTFQLISYAIDRFRDEIEPPPFLDFVLYISFFPQLVAGPIVRLREIASQIRTITEFRITAPLFLHGFTYFVSGLAFKVLIADSLGNTIKGVVSELSRLSSIDAFYVLFAYSFQIYFDFYGYSLIAIGFAAWFGITLPQNFHRPYESETPREFWRRWHMTLSYWIRDYLYLPLGGNRSYITNIFIIFLVVGLWHGAGWNFIAWGALHACLVLCIHFVRTPWAKMPVLLQKTLTFVLISFGWLLFLFDFETAFQFLERMGALNDFSSQLSIYGWLMLAVAALVCFGINVEKIAEQVSDFRHWVLSGVVYGTLIYACVIMIDFSDTFIYFRF